MSEKLVTGDMRRLPGLTPRVERHEVATRGPVVRGTGMRIEPGTVRASGPVEPVAVYHPVAKRRGQ